MATVGTLIVKLQADISDFARGMDSAMRKLDHSMQAAAPASKALLGGIVGLGASFVGLGVAGVKLASELELAEVAFTTLLGSADEADTMIRDIQQFAARTPFEVAGLIGATKSLIAFGVESEDALPILQRLGDIAAGLNIPVGELAEIYGRARVQGRLFAEDINQLTGRGIPIIAELAKQFGVAESEIRELVKEGQVEFKHLEQAFISLTSEGGRFAGLMDAQSRTVQGLFSTLKDDVSLTLTALGQVIIESFDLHGVIESLLGYTGQVRVAFEGFRETVEEVGIREAILGLIPEGAEGKIVVIAGAIAGALVPAIWLLAKGLIAATLPLLPFIAAGALLAGLAYLIYTNWEPITEFFQTTWTAIVEGATQAWTTLTTWLTTTWTTIVGTATTTWAGLPAFITGIWASIKQSIWDAMVSIVASVLGSHQEAEHVVSNAWTAIQNAATAAVKFLSSLLHAEWNAIQSTSSSVWGAISTELTAAWTIIQNVVRSALTVIVPLVEAQLRLLLAIVDGTWQLLRLGAIAVWEGLRLYIESTLQALAGIFTAILQAIGGDWEGAWDTLQRTAIGFLTSMREGIWRILGDMAVGIYQQGRALAERFGQGIRDALERALSAAGELASRLRDLLPGSDAKRGPLSDLLASGRAVPATLAEGILRERAILEQAIQAATGGMMAQVTLSPRIVPERARGLGVASARADLTPHIHFEAGAIVIHAPNGRAREVEIGVRRALRAAGVAS